MADTLVSTGESVVEFRAMGSPCRVVVAGGPSNLAMQSRELVEDLERRWSRFLSDSEVSAVNRSAGAVTIVSAETHRLFRSAVTAADAATRWFNPLMLNQLVAAGYGQPWVDEAPPCPPVSPATSSSNGSAGSSQEPIVLYPEVSAVRLPAGTRFDPGGIGKGLAIDMAIELCVARGATTASVELGGDLRVFGSPWYGPAWEVGVEDPFGGDDQIANITPTEGAVTTSTTRKRSWVDQGGNPLHHLIDPATGRSAVTDLVAVTTCSGAAWWAEVAAKSALIAGSVEAPGVLEALGTPGILIKADGSLVSVGAEAP